MFPEFYEFDFIPFIKEEELTEQMQQDILKYWDVYRKENVSSVSVYSDADEIGIILFCKTKIIPCSVETSCMTKTITIDNKYSVTLMHSGEIV